MVPLLFVLYAALELLAVDGGHRLAGIARSADSAGPVLGALLGVIPQCGMSVFMSSLFLWGRISRGTLVATYIATSDEALPVMLAHGRQGRLVLAIVAGKLVIAVLAGFLVDLVVRERYHGVHGPPPDEALAPRPCGTRHATNYGRLVRHALGRTLNIFGWVFAMTLLVGAVVHRVDGTAILEAATRHRFLGVIATALFGLVPNCAVSIAIAEGALRGLLPFSATMAGLSAGAGYGPILLLKEGSTRTAVSLLLTCLALSVTAGFGFALLGW
jgi:hypothetical protein